MELVLQTVQVVPVRQKRLFGRGTHRDLWLLLLLGGPGVPQTHGLRSHPTAAAAAAAAVEGEVLLSPPSHALPILLSVLAQSGRVGGRGRAHRGRRGVARAGRGRRHLRGGGGRGYGRGGGRVLDGAVAGAAGAGDVRAGARRTVGRGGVRVDEQVGGGRGKGHVGEAGLEVVGVARGGAQRDFAARNAVGEGRVGGRAQDDPPGVLSVHVHDLIANHDEKEERKKIKTK